MLGIDGTSFFRYFHTVTHYSDLAGQNQPLFQYFFRTPPPRGFLGNPVAVKPEFLHKENPMVKFTACEKVGKASNQICIFYVNPPCISPTECSCGKPLWKNLWRMWKTHSYQQYSQRSPQPDSLWKTMYTPMNNFVTILKPSGLCRVCTHPTSEKNPGKKLDSSGKMLSNLRCPFRRRRFFCGIPTKERPVSSADKWESF